MGRWIKILAIAAILVGGIQFYRVIVLGIGQPPGNWKVQLYRTWVNFKEGLEPRVSLAAEMEKHNPYKNTYEFTADWFSNKVPVWEVALEKYKGKPNLKYLEVGVYEGSSVMWMLENVLTDPSSTVTAVDIFWGPKDEYDPEVQARWDRNVAAAGATDRVTTLVGWSGEVLRTLPPNTYDIIYIDASHYTPEVLEDAVLSLRLLKEGGIMIFDDYRWWAGMPELKRPKLAIDTFVNIYQNKVRVIHNDYQLVLIKEEKPDLNKVGWSPVTAPVKTAPVKE